MLPLDVNGLEERLARIGDPLAGRVALVGYGSNAAPSQLRRKLAAHEPGWAVPVAAARLREADAVYSAHITRYGAIPATLHPSPGTAIDVVVTLLSPRQAELVRASEGGNYDLVPLDPGRAGAAGGSRPAPRGPRLPVAARRPRDRRGPGGADGGPVSREDAPRGDRGADAGPRGRGADPRR